MGIGKVLETAATIAVVVVWFVALRPVALGGPASYIVVHGYSMSGTVAPGDLVVTEAQGKYSIGDAIVYHVPEGAGRGLLVVHRIVGADASGYRVQGDANSHQDPWQPKSADIVGRLIFTLAGYGPVLTWLAKPFVLGAIWGVVAFIISLSFLPPARSPKSHARAKPKHSLRRGRAYPSLLDVTTALAISVLVGLVMLIAIPVVAPAWSLVTAIVSTTSGLATLVIALFLLPESSIRRLRCASIPRIGVRPTGTPPVHALRGRKAIGAASALAACGMVGLVMLSAIAMISPAHAVGLSVHADVASIRLTYPGH